MRQSGQKFECSCASGFYGQLCQNTIDACYGDPCLNNGTCKIVEEGRFECQCKLFWVIEKAPLIFQANAALKANVAKQTLTIARTTNAKMEPNALTK